ncbi:MAG TPA: class I SAM-dependent methyltransferase [Acidimicrobiia bacterium]|jgi:2-polyprenyl-3-methyl-5-hydroxy-6-metoxy-1,4-benzoquinol methylase|nr:class I SAM-dependent methyltransferase [Acidimicrobiia bacterium]
MDESIADEIRTYYEDDYDESQRITKGLNELELVRTREIIERHIPRGPLRVLDVGGGTGVHAKWLAELGHQVELVDPMPRHVAAAQTLADSGLPITAGTGDARRLSQVDDRFDAVLLLGPLYHLTERADRVQAWREALRVVKPGGVVIGAAISRFASLFDGIAADFFVNPDFRVIVEQDIATGQHRNPDRVHNWFTTSYFHLPQELEGEAAEAGAGIVGLFGVEGLAGWLPHLAGRWDDPVARELILFSIRATESEPSLGALSQHLLLVTRKTAG